MVSFVARFCLLRCAGVANCNAVLHWCDGVDVSYATLFKLIHDEVSVMLCNANFVVNAFEQCGVTYVNAITPM